MKDLKLVLILLAFAVTVIFSACDNSSGSSGSGGGTGAVVYAGGYIDDPSPMAAYWNDGTVHVLEDNYESEVRSIAVDGGSVYSGGYKYDDDGNKLPGYWKNSTWIDNTTDYLAQGEVYSMIMNNGDAYSCGYADDSSGYFWKNGAKIAAYSTKNSLTRAMAVDQKGYFYFGGDEQNATSYAWAAGEWGFDSADPGNSTNFTFAQYNTATSTTPLTTSAFDSSVNAIAVVEGEPLVVYAGGYSETAHNHPKVAGYWYGVVGGTKIWIALSDGITDAEVAGIVVDGSDTYAGGYVTNASGRKEAGYWKNGTWTSLPNPNGLNDAEVTCMVITGNDIYAGGYAGYVPGYWKNAEWNSLSGTMNYAGKVLSLVVQ